MVIGLEEEISNKVTWSSVLLLHKFGNLSDIFIKNLSNEPIRSNELKSSNSSGCAIQWTKNIFLPTFIEEGCNWRKREDGQLTKTDDGSLGIYSKIKVDLSELNEK